MYEIVTSDSNNEIRTIIQNVFYYNFMYKNAILFQFSSMENCFYLFPLIKLFCRTMRIFS
ncbi:hypothetical protein BUQ74_08335 [Leptospira weilii serovar Heyan]|nr:hypothetical protein BUQ74_08335 [Leptospira weilii serovar Heyan]QDK24250.1 hypothetical protein FHG67_17175 [Leptospira weilii]QDK28210.1 hypothetical protein FHG68_17220 [Leptospira weilii]